MAKIEKELSEHFANINGEALAAKVLATLVLDMFAKLAADKRKFFAASQAAVDEMLKGSTFVEGDPALSERTLEVARARAEEILALLQRRNPG